MIRMRIPCGRESRPTWARGLKHGKADSAAIADRSRPAWARGLKHWARRGPDTTGGYFKIVIILIVLKGFEIIILKAALHKYLFYSTEWR
jgi:hypothetical protein